MWRRTRSIALAIAFALSAFQAPADARSYDAGKIDPALLTQVLADPKADYDVIVRSAVDPTARKGDKSDRGRKAGDEIVRSGGKAKFSLGIVGGATGRMKGEQILGLTNSQAIDYVFADAPIRVNWDPVADAGKATTPGIVSINAPQAWSQYGVSGRGVGVAVIDSGVYAHPDLAGRIVASIDFTNSTTTTTTTDPVTGLTTTTTTTTTPTATAGPSAVGDPGGHGTHIAGLVAGNGTSSGSAYTGAAPGANVVDVRVIDANGASNTGLVLRGMQWVINNRAAYNIKVVNLSLGTPVTKSYKLDPLATGAQVLRFAGITVVVSAGNLGPIGATITSPGNDPFVISVAAIDDAQTATNTDDTIASFSSRGRTPIDSIAKPDVSAPGRRMVSLRSPGSTLDTLYPERRVNGTDTSAPAYFRLSGTSMAAPLVAGTVALMLERNPTLRPDQVKKRLKSGATELAGYGSLDQGEGRIDALKAVGSIDPSREYSQGRVTDSFAKDMRKFIQGQPLVWRDLTYNGGVDPHNITWGNVTWENITWENITWENLTWENFTWENITWETITWENITWESADTLAPLTGNGGWILVD